jgi:hypothetical protein
MATGSFSGKINELGSEFVTAAEWGIFGGPKFTPDPLRTRIVDNLAKAQAAVKTGDLVIQQTAFLEAKDAFSEAQRRRPVWYLANTRFGLLPLIFTTLTTALAYWFVFVQCLALPIDQVTRHAAFWGLSGAVLKALYWLQFQINRGVLRPRWLAYFLVAPFIGILLGAISALIVKVGFKLFDEGAAPVIDWRVIGLFAAFAGFNWEWALEKFRYGAEAVASRMTDRSGSTGKTNG